MHLARALQPFSICGTRDPFFHHPFGVASGKRLLVSQKARTLGFGYPFCELTPNPLEAYFSPQRSWVSLFRAFLLFGDRSGRFQPSIFALALD